MLLESSDLRRVRLSSIATRLLDEPRLKPRFLENFYATYRVRKHPFFPLFLSVKWSSVSLREVMRKEKLERIEAIMARYPPDVLRLMRYLAAVEAKIRRDSPLSGKVLLPRTLKRAKELAAFTRARWSALFRDAIASLASGYRSIVLAEAEELLARSILDCLPDPRTGKAPPNTAVKGKFRALSKVCHPDSGGDPAAFRILSWARDILLG